MGGGAKGTKIGREEWEIDRSGSRMSPQRTSYDYHRPHHRPRGATASPRVSLRHPLLLHCCDCRKGGLRALGRLADLHDVL